MPNLIEGGSNVFSKNVIICHLSMIYSSYEKIANMSKNKPLD